MKCILLGTGTSQGIPVIGCNCHVCSSSDPKDKRLRVSCYIEDCTTSKKILIDIGPDFRQQMLAHSISDIDAVFITHEHNDHIAGLDDIRSINFLHKKNMPVYGLPRVIDDIKNRFKYIFSAKKYPGTPQIELHPKHNNFNLGELRIQVLPIVHGKLEIIGFRINNFAYITDASFIPPSTMEMLKDLDTLVINALRREKHHSHFNLEEALEQIKKINAKRSYLTHISHVFETHENINNMLPKGVLVGYDGLSLTI